jgi:hypothetical protein
MQMSEEGGDWREVSRIVLHLNPEHEPQRATRAFEPSGAREVDDGARKSASSARRCCPLTNEGQSTPRVN